MRISYVALGALAVASTSCLSEIESGESLVIECQDSTECPSGYTCRVELSLCIPLEEASEAAVSITSAEVDTRVAREGSVIGVDFTVSGELLGNPSVTLSTSPPLSFDLISEENLSFRFELAIDSLGTDGNFPVVISYLDASGNAVESSLDTQLVELDFTLPGFSAFVANNTFALRHDVDATVSFIVSEPLSSAAVTLSNGALMDLDADASTESSYTFHTLILDTTPDGPLDASITIVDSAGNQRQTNLEDVFVIDATPPSVESIEVVKPAVREGDLARVRFSGSEDLGSQMLVNLVDRANASTTYQLEDVQIVGSTVTAGREVTSSLPTGNYDIVLMSFFDLAGNPGAMTTLGQLSVDSQAPDIGPITAGPDFASVGQTVTASFTLSENVGTASPGLIARFGGVAMDACSVSGDGPFVYLCTYQITTPGEDGAEYVSVTASDGAGNAAVQTSNAVNVDFSAPEQVGLSALVRRDRPTATVLDENAPNAADRSRVFVTLEAGLVIDVSFAMNEPVTVLSWNAPEMVDNGSSPTFVNYQFVTGGGALRNDGDQVALRATVADSAGNVSELDIGTVVFDGTASAFDPSKLVLFRAPWGTNRPTGPEDNNIDPEPPGTNRLLIEADSGLADGDTLFVLTAESVATATRIAVQDIGATPPASVPLSSTIDGNLFVAVQDRAGNESDADLGAAGAQAERVTRGRWVASFNNDSGQQELVTRTTTFWDYIDDNVAPPVPHTYAEVGRSGDSTQAGEQQSCLSGCNNVGQLFPSDGGRELSAQNPDTSDEVLIGFGEEATGPWPGRRYGTAAAYDSVSDSVLLYGGVTDDPGVVFFADTWLFDGTDWTAVPGSAGSRAMAQAVPFDYSDRDGQTGSVLLFGGVGSLFEFDFNAPCWFSVWTGNGWIIPESEDTDCLGPGSGPDARIKHGMAYDPTNNRAYILGGSYDDSLLSDFWQVEVRSNGRGLEATQLATSPAALEYPGVAFDQSRNVLVAFGGYDGSQATNALYEWDGSSWSLRCSETACDTMNTCACENVPSARWGANAWYDPNFGGVLFAGGPTFPDDQQILLWKDGDFRVVYDELDDDACTVSPCVELSIAYELEPYQTVVFDRSSDRVMFLDGGFFTETGPGSTFENAFYTVGPKDLARPAIITRMDYATQQTSSTLDRIRVEAYAAGDTHYSPARIEATSVPGASLELWDATNERWEEFARNDTPILFSTALDQSLDIEFTTNVENYRDENDGVWIRFRTLGASAERNEVWLDYLQVTFDYTVVE